MNTYLAEYEEAMHDLSLLGYREGADLLPLRDFFNAAVLPLRRTYAWGVPSAEALQAIADASPHGVVEVGAGTGYWAHLLELEHGTSVSAFDVSPCQLGDINGFHALANVGNVIPFANVSSGGAEVAALYPQRTLLLCWPPRESDGSGTGERDVAMMACDALNHYTGETVAYVGVCAAASLLSEPAAADGSMADAAAARHDTAGGAFEAALTANFELVRQVALPNWPPLKDSLTLWRRKGTSTAPPPPTPQPPRKLHTTKPRRRAPSTCLKST